MTTLITYKITGDIDGKLKQAARTTCNFWNHYLTPATSVVIRVGIDTMGKNTIAESYEPYHYAKILYGQVNFNRDLLGDYTPHQLAATIIHEVGHTLGIGWNRWMELFSRRTGKF